MNNINDVKNDLAPTGILRVAINYGNPVLAQRHPQKPEPQGVSAALARALAERLGLEIRFVSFDSAGLVFDAVKDGLWDLAFMAIDPRRAEGVDFTAPYVFIEGTYLVPKDAVWQSVDEFDQAGLRIAVGRGAAYDLFLSRHLQRAELVRVATSEAAIHAFVDGQADCVAGVRQPLEAFAAEHAQYRVIEDSFTTIRQAMAVPKGRKTAQAFLETFIAEMKASGFIAQALKDSNQLAASVAP